MSSGPNSYVATVDIAIADKLKDALVEKGFVLSQPAHTLFSGRKPGVSCTLYLSGKLVVQGKEKNDFIEFFLEPEILGQFTYRYPQEAAPTTANTQARIGIDESGKGDLFGPLCIAGLYAGGAAVETLRTMGVRDSKTMNDAVVRQVAAKLRDNYKYSIVRINPDRYNSLYREFRNLNHLLAWGHVAIGRNPSPPARPSIM